MKIALLIPDRRDRPKFLANCLRMMQNQTLKADHIELVNDVPMSSKKDITWRYRTGYNRLINKGFDVILFIENDDWYSPIYIETMVNKWIESGKPKMLGTSYTIYYHLKEHKYVQLHHKRRSSAMSTLIVPDLNIDWCVDHDPYTDMHLWKNIGGVIFTPPQVICLGMKHGEGLTGGSFHTDRMHRYIGDDGIEFLALHLDKDSFKFYTSYYEIHC